MNALLEILKQKPRSYLEGLVVTMWKGEVEFDLGESELTRTKSKLIDYIAANFNESQINDAMNCLAGKPVVVAQAQATPGPSGDAGKVAGDVGDALTSLFQGSIEKAVKKATDPEAMRKMVQDEVKKLPALRLELVVNQEVVSVKDGYTRPEFQPVVARAVQRINCLMVGPAGCGKTMLARQVADAMKLRFGSISCSAGMSESHLTGWLLPIGESNKFNYVPSVFVDIYENGGVFLFDEIDAADSNTLLFVNQALANGGFFLPQRHEKPEVKRHKDCVILAAANTFGTGGNMVYAGRERLDEATIDRFRAGVVEIGYDKTLEEQLVDPDLLKWGLHVRGKITEAKLQRVMSTRFLVDATKLKKAGMDTREIVKTYFMGWREDEQRKVG